MGRLIDADKLESADFSECIDSMEIMAIIDAQPTAYDPDKVVEQLEDRSEEYNSGVRLHGKPEEMLTDDAIEIVKGGGVDAD